MFLMASLSTAYKGGSPNSREYMYTIKQVAREYGLERSRSSLPIVFNGVSKSVMPNLAIRSVKVVL